MHEVVQRWFFIGCKLVPLFFHALVTEFVENFRTKVLNSEYDINGSAEVLSSASRIVMALDGIGVKKRRILWQVPAALSRSKCLLTKLCTHCRTNIKTKSLNCMEKQLGS